MKQERFGRAWVWWLKSERLWAILWPVTSAFVRAKEFGAMGEVASHEPPESPPEAMRHLGIETPSAWLEVRGVVQWLE